MDNRFLELEDITKKNFKECLTYLCYISDYNQEQKEKLNKINGGLNT